MLKYLAVTIIMVYDVADDAGENSGNVSDCSGSEGDIIV